MTLRRGLRRTLVAAVVTAALVGCGAEEEPTKKATPAATKPAAVPDELVGTWVRKLGPSNGDYGAGTYTVKLLADGSVEAYFAGSNTAKSCLTQKRCEVFTVEASAGKLSIPDTADCLSPGEYTYKVTRNMLKTKRAHDDCSSSNSERPRLFANATWRRQG